MKRIGLWGGLLVLVLLLTACGQGGASVQDVMYGGETYTVDTENQTITHDGAVIQVTWIERGGNDQKWTFTYPDGSAYWWEQSGGVVMGGWLYGCDSERSEQYADGNVLREVWMQSLQNGFQWGANPLPGLLLILFGAVGAAAPKAVWYLDCGWRYRNAEPSDLALLVHRVGGGIAVLVGLVLLFV